MLKVDKTIQLIGIVLRFLVGLSGSEDILGKKRALTDLSPKVCITSLNPHFSHQKPQPKMLRRKKAEPKIPHFLGINQDIVAWAQEEKCGLKYVSCSSLPSH